MQPKRIAEIDYLRGIAMLGMILIHTTYYFLSDKIALFIWNWSQFAVPVFIFCSSYLFFQKPLNLTIFKYLRKRSIRLLMPYWIFMVFFFLLVFIREPLKLSPYYIIQSVFVVGGIDISWLVLLFLQLTLILQVILISAKKSGLLFSILLFFSFASSMIFLFFHFGISYKYIMWLPWTLILFYAYFFTKFQFFRKFSWVIIVLAFAVFLSTRFLLKEELKSLSFYDNKYPPNIYFISYGILCIELLFLISKKNLLDILLLSKLLLFLSKNSYTVFFIHSAVLYIFVGFLHSFGFSWFLFFFLILSISIGITRILNWLYLLNSKRYVSI